MSAFDQREQSFEKAHALAEEQRFKILARRNKSLGLWAAEQLGLSGLPATAHADALVASQVGEADDETLARALIASLSELRPEISPHRIRRKIEQATAHAAREIAAGR